MHSVLFIFLMLLAVPAFSQETQPGDACGTVGIIAQTGGPEQTPARRLICNGSVWKTVDEVVATGRSSFQVDNDTGACNSDKTGRLRYASVTDAWEYCTGSAWLPFKEPCANDGAGACWLNAARSNSDPQFVAANIASGVNILGVTGTLTGGLTGPAGCANIGDLCADGTVFAGYHPITQEHLFIPTTDQGTTSQWKTSTGTNDIATDSTYDGRANTNQVANSTTFPAFKLCKDLGTGGHADWYLPSQVELYYLWSVRGTIEAGGNITNFQNAFYWCSTEYNTVNAWYQYFTNGNQSYSVKANAYRVRCLRR